MLALALGLFTQFGNITIWHIYVITALSAVAISFDSPARQSLVPNLVPAKDLPNAFSLTSIAFQTGAVIGPALSGVVIAVWGQQAVYYINAVSFLAVILALFFIGDVPQKIEQRTKGISLSSIGDGIRFILSETDHLFHHDPGFHRHLLCIGKYAHAVRCARRAAGWCGGVWLALGSTIGGGGAGGVDPLTGA